jgi:hypothetical protein
MYTISVKYKYNQFLKFFGIKYESGYYEYTDFNKIPKYNDIIEMICWHSNLYSLPILPANINRIKFSFNKNLTLLPEFPNSLEYIDFYYNNLITLPKLPDSLIELICDINQLTELPELPNSLILLRCSDNQLTSLPELPNSIQSLSINNNKIKWLPNIPKSMYIFNHSNIKFINKINHKYLAKIIY